MFIGKKIKTTHQNINHSSLPLAIINNNKCLTPNS